MISNVGNIDKTCSKFIGSGMLCIALICGAACYVMTLIAEHTVRTTAISSLSVSAAFFFIFVVTEGLVWRKVATSHPDSLPTFFTATSGFRLLLSLAVMLGYYIACGREQMPTFFLVFAVFYTVLLLHHTIFFARVSNRSQSDMK